MKKILLVLMLLPCFTLSAYADTLFDAAAEVFEVNRLEDGLRDEEKKISGKPSMDGAYDAGGAISRLCKSFGEKLISELKANYNIGLALIGIAFLCGFGQSVCKGGVSEYIELLGVCAAASLLISGVDSIAAQTIDSMYRLSDYSKAALPVVFSAAAAGGAVASSGAKFAAVGFALDVLMSISQKLIIPVVYAYIALVSADSVFPNRIISAMSGLAKWAATIIMTGMTIAFTAYINLTGIMTSAVDAAAVKTARTVISNTLPVVGGMISDASAMVLSAAGVVRNCSGVFGLIAVCILCAGPFAMLSVKMLIIKAASLIAGAVQCRQMTKLLDGIGAAMGLLMGLLGCCGIMLFISLTAGMKAVSGI